MNTDAGLGFGHFIAQSDGLGKTLLAILVLMSVVSWAIIAIKGLTLLARKRRSLAFLNFFWNATSLDAVAGEIATHGARDPFSHLTSHAMHAQAHHAKYGAAKLEEAGSASEFVTRTIKKVLDEETTRLENGLSVLATVPRGGRNQKRGRRSGRHGRQHRLFSALQWPAVSAVQDRPGQRRQG